MQKFFPAPGPAGTVPVAWRPAASSLVALGLIFLGPIALGLSACGAPAEPPQTADTAVNRATKPAAPFHSDARAGNCVAGTFFKAELLGAVNGRIDADAGHLRCEGGPRPEGQGARLYFALPEGDSSGLAVILALPTLERGKDGTELPARLTVILEGEARFFSTQSLETCWADITSSDPPHASADDLPAGASADGGQRYLLRGQLYCIAPLAEVGGMDSVTVEDIEFQGVLDWGPG